MKTNMNTDLEFLLELRKRLIAETRMLRFQSSVDDAKGKFCQADKAAAKSDQCEDVADKITEYLKTRGIE